MELLLRGSDDSSHIRAYECTFNYSGGVQIVRWNVEPLGDFTFLPISDWQSLGRES